ncbi:hypothetical protein QBZ16_005072 [Prototheca wickerhamii]|uniref:RING-type domain-containing protein n=1 Tax=Prototheca wickerhamii TaxID=3111 RepID=A0AAD9MJP2_PROWI|nr:hypothetical protein QBZ16_005072 [Prototheca wickerhamii]
MDASSDSGPGPDQARQVSVLVHRADGPGEEQREAAAPDDPAPDDQEQGLVESAERHRLTTSIGLDLEGVSVFLELNAPYLGIMIFLFVCSHILLLLGFSALTAALRRLNRVARDGIAARSDRDGRTTRRLLLAAAAAALTGLPALALLLQPRSVESAMRGFWSCLLLVVCVDSALRVLLSSCKLGLAAMLRSEAPKARRRRSAALTFVEHAGALARSGAPLALWLRYLWASPSGTPVIASYLLLKTLEGRTRVRALAAAARQLLHSEHGSAPTPEEVAEAGSLCPICQEAPTAPTKLACGHIFCDACVSEWFERERSCPMCRAATGGARVKSCSDGRTSLAPMLF